MTIDCASFYNSLDTTTCSDNFRGILAFLVEYYATSRFENTWQGETNSLMELYEICKDSDDFFPLATLVGHTSLEAISHLASRCGSDAQRLEQLARLKNGMRDYLKLIEMMERNGAPLSERALIALDPSLLPDWYAYS